MHTLILGTTGKGKSTAVRHLVGNDQFLCLDFQKKSTAWNLAAARGAVLEDFDSEFCIPFKSWESEREIEELLTVLLRRRGSLNADAHPQLETVTQQFLRLCRPEDDFRWCTRFFRHGTVYKQMLDRCEDLDCVDWWHHQPASAVQWERITSPTERLVSILRKFAGRIQNDSRFYDLLQRGESYSAEGGDVITESELRFALAWRLRQFLRWKRETRNDRPFTVVLEECDASGLLGIQEVTDLLTQRKNNVHFIIVSQTGYFGDDATTNAVWNNTSQIILGCQSAEVARRAADAMTGMINPHAVKEFHEKQIRLGEDDFIETYPRYFTVQEQHTQMMKWVMNLERGEAFTIQNGNVRFVRFPALPTPTTLGEQTWLVPTRSEEKESKQTRHSQTNTPTPLNKLFE